ncbi:acyl-CoA synthetase (AMP-forming)/AMP-acid ligase II [Actinocorallia herbida]|uniref:Acyl-CoA synthetase (AMP-forming)/AMP-acid ligase II n=1 Tax=Actinocorallia herbida TaxID=58109 RepID=A0A3N1D0M8_9ACTN|nr:AMP-binding protein [Actinocorallia herbida]ROO87056.1 acyl-CoA synthetase (AMP-forming)/AMP-acid ligase II [Actinocorallia herbida]
MLLADIVERNARSFPDRQALWFDEDTTRSWAALARRTHRLANAIRGLTAPGERVAILAENCPEYYECYYGVPDSGRVLTLLNYRLHPEELLWILNDAEATVLIAQSSYAAVLQDLRAELPFLREIVTVGPEVTGTSSYEALLGAASDGRSPEADGDDPAWIVYTSGTTGRPKGAMLSHRNLLTAVVQSVVHYAPGPRARFLNAFPLCHVSGYMAITHQFRGGTVLQQGPWRPDAWLRTVEEQGVTSAGMAPSMMADVLDDPAIGHRDVSSLAALGYGSAGMPVGTLRRAVDRFGPIIFTGFGMTETAGNVLALDRETHARAARGDDFLLESAGAAMCMSEARIVDEDGAEVPNGTVGELVVRGDQTTLGYLGRPEATAAAYADGWLHTGDLARKDDEGFFYIVDRKKDMIITGGENVYSTEVEHTLARHPAVAESAVFGVPDLHWGEAVAAAVVLRPGHHPTADDLMDFCRAHIAGYKRPRHVFFTDALPKTVTGKAMKHELKRSFGRSLP